MLKLEPSQTNDLLAQPESGMGYQLVEVTMADRGGVRAVVYNADLLLLESESKTRLLTESYDRLVRTAENAGGRIQAIRVVQRGPAALGQRVMERPTTMAQEARKPGPAKDAPREKTRFGEIFKRFTAFSNDRRVGPDKSLLPGTYATTKEDATHVKTGRDAVARYALPNPAPASYVFTAIPADETSIQRGIVEPAYGQPGGGVEVIFPDGTEPSSVLGPNKIPD